MKKLQKKSAKKSEKAAKKEPKPNGDKPVEKAGPKPQTGYKIITLTLPSITQS